MKKSPFAKVASLVPVEVPSYIVLGEGEGEFHEAQGNWPLGTIINTFVDLSSKQKLNVVEFGEGVDQKNIQDGEYDHILRVEHCELEVRTNKAYSPP